MQATAEQQRLKRLYRTLWETTTYTVLIIDTGSVIRFANPSGLQLFQCPPEQLAGKPLALERKRNESELQCIRATAERRWASVPRTP